jgi:diacylglycerol kinase family enzyme
VSVAVVLNPTANGGLGRVRWKALLETELAREAGLRDAEVFDGSGKGGLGRLDGWLRERLAGGARRIVAAGGDGTVNLALNALLAARGALEPAERAKLALGAVGLGSSNDFQKPFDGSGRAVAAGLRCRLDFAAARPHDVGRASVAGGGVDADLHFLINASIGVTAEANWRFNHAGPFTRALKRRWVDGAILATALRTFAAYRNLDVELALDGASPARLRLTNLGVVKNVHFSGQMRYDTPQACDDGRFGVHVCEDMSRREMLGVLKALNRGRFRGLRKTWSRQAKEVGVRAPEAFSVETDGEVIQAREARFRVLARELRVCP